MGDGMLSLYWNNHRATFCHILATLREKERYTDATLACDGKFYPVHKLVLSTCSEYFEKIFEHTPCKHPVIVLKDIKADALEALLNYMYAGYVNVAQNDLARLIKAAETLSIKGLAVPDEPPPGEDNKASQPRTGREERSSPQPKRRRREENGGSQLSTSPPSSPRASPYQPDGEHSRSRAPSEGHRSERLESTEQPVDQPSVQESQESDVKVMVDESLVKEEMVETLDSSQSEGMDTSIQYSGVPSDPSMDGTTDEHSNRLMPNKYDQPPIIPGQTQPLADAVAEALAGPSGMQGWLGSELPGSGGYQADTYAADGNPEVHPAPAGAPHSQQRVGLADAAPPGGGGRGRGSGRGRSHKCPSCSYTTSVTTNLKNHMRIHTGEKPFQCQYCSYTTTQKGSLLIHTRKHTGEKPFGCSFCDYRSATRGNLKAHQAVHQSRGNEAPTVKQEPSSPTLDKPGSSPRPDKPGSSTPKPDKLNSSPPQSDKPSSSTPKYDKPNSSPGCSDQKNSTPPPHNPNSPPSLRSDHKDSTPPPDQPDSSPPQPVSSPVPCDPPDSPTPPSFSQPSFFSDSDSEMSNEPLPLVCLLEQHSDSD